MNGIEGASVLTQSMNTVPARADEGSKCGGLEGRGPTLHRIRNLDHDTASLRLHP